MADAAASRAAVDGDEEATAVSHADNRAVRFVFEQRLTEWGRWGAGLRRTLTQVCSDSAPGPSNLAGEAGSRIY